MGDDSSFRARRDGLIGSGPAARTRAGTVDDAEDALAELARLMGEDDPFADLAATPDPRSTPASASAPFTPSQQRSPLRAETSAPERRFDDWQAARRAGSMPQPGRVSDMLDPRPAPSPATPQAASRAPAASFQAEEPPAFVRQGYGSLAARRGEAVSAPASNTRQPQAGDYDERGAHGAPASSSARASTEQDYDFEADQDEAYDAYDETYDPAYEDDGYMPPHGDEVYEDEPRRRRGRMVLIAAICVAGLGVVSAAGLLSYRMVGGRSSGSDVSASGAPVIKADTTPTKMAAPAPDGVPGGDGPKMIYDRQGSAQTGKERMVPREEQPVDVNTAAAAAPVSSNPIQGGMTEPKRVKTLAVRADGTMIASSAAAPAIPASAMGPIAYAPTQNPSPVGLPTPTPVTTMPTNSAGMAVSSAESGGGDYVIQVSSQKSEKNALASWKVLQGRLPQLLSGYKAVVKKVDLGDKGSVYRAQIGPFASRDEAISLCNTLRAQDGECVVTRSN